MALLTNLGTGKEYLLDGGGSIGRKSDNDIILNDEAVSGHHATITNTGSAWYISDNNSRNGVEMNGFRIPSVGKLGLREGCQLKLGNTCLRFTTDSEAINKYLAMHKKAKNSVSNASQASSNAARASSKGANSGWKKKNKRIAVVATVILIVLACCLANHFSGNAKMRAGNYVGAISSYENDFLFSRSQRVEAIMLAGEDAFSRQDFDAAIEFFLSAGSAGKERWSDAVYEKAKSLIEDGSPYRAIELLEKIGDETRAQEQIGVAHLSMAQEEYEAGRFDKAIQIAQGIENTKYADVTAFLDKVYHATGDDFFHRYHYQEALDAYRSCENDPQAKTNAEILDKLIAEDYYEAAVLADSAIHDGSTDYPREDWFEVLGIFTGNSCATDISQALTVGAAKNILSENIAFESSDAIDAFRRAASKFYMVGSFHSGVSTYVIDSLSDLYKQCGKDPQGKILIITQKHSFPDRTVSQAVDFNLMRLLPTEYYPLSLEEVEYVVLVTYDYGTEGRYQYKTVALREYADVRVLKLPTEAQIYRSSRIQGDSSPNSFTYTGEPPEWKSGGAPNMGEEIHSALSSIIR